MSPSVEALWIRYCIEVQGQVHPDDRAPLCDAFYFCDNAADADTCADLVARGVKRATACSLAELEREGRELPQAGDMAIVTTWDGQAVALIQTTDVTVRRFGDVDPAFAAAEGEGDGSLAWWRDAHHSYYARVLAGSGVMVDEDLLIACETFECVLLARPAAHAQ